MAQFIIVTDARGTEHRLNVAHIAAYSATASDKGCEATIKLANEITAGARKSICSLRSNGRFMLVFSSPRYIRAEREASLKNGRGACRLRRSFSKRRVDDPRVITPP